MKLRKHVLACCAAPCAALLLSVPAHAAASADEGAVGGRSFNSAVPVGPRATLTDRVPAGDQLFWWVELKPGESLSVEAELDLPARFDPGKGYARFGVQLYDPTRNPAYCKGDHPRAGISRFSSAARDGGTVRADCSVGDPGDRDRAVERGGTWYVQAGVGRTRGGEGEVLPMRVTVSKGKGIAADPSEASRPDGSDEVRGNAGGVALPLVLPGATAGALALVRRRGGGAR